MHYALQKINVDLKSSVRHPPIKQVDRDSPVTGWYHVEEEWYGKPNNPQPTSAPDKIAMTDKNSRQSTVPCRTQGHSSDTREMRKTTMEMCVTTNETCHQK